MAAAFSLKGCLALWVAVVALLLFVAVPLMQHHYNTVVYPVGTVDYGDAEVDESMRYTGVTYRQTLHKMWHHAEELFFGSVIPTETGEA